ncbi:hypothetical protein NQZ79_g5950 [Umbelopsis isabellina]|nr:hypothetical protein NQZ79_g5950 [Umbelopsis isabellina]
MRNSLNDILRRSVRMKELNSLTAQQLSFNNFYHNRSSNLNFGNGLRRIARKEPSRRRETCNFCSCTIVSPLMKNYLLRRSYVSEALRTIEPLCDQYAGTKRPQQLVSKLDTKKELSDRKRISFLKSMKSIQNKTKNNENVDPQLVTELWRKFKVLNTQPNTVSQLSALQYEDFMNVLENCATKSHKSKMWSRMRELFEESCNSLETPSIPLLQSGLTAYSRSGNIKRCLQLVAQGQEIMKDASGPFLELQYSIFGVYLRLGKSKEALEVLIDIRTELSKKDLVKAIELMAGATARRRNTAMLFQALEATGIEVLIEDKHVARKVVDAIWKGQWLAITDMTSKKNRTEMMDALRQLNVTKSQDFAFICQNAIVQALRNLDQTTRNEMKVQINAKNIQWIPPHLSELFTVERIAIWVELALTAFPKLQPPSHCLHDLLHLFSIYGDIDTTEKLLTIFRDRGNLTNEKDIAGTHFNFDVSRSSWHSPSFPAKDDTIISEKQPSHITTLQDETLNNIHSQQLSLALMHDFLVNKQWDECIAMYDEMKCLNQDFAYRGDHGLLECAVIAYAAKQDWQACQKSLCQAMSHNGKSFSTVWLEGVLNRMVYLSGRHPEYLSGKLVLRTVQTVQNNCNIRLDISYTNALIRKFGEQRDLSGAFRIYKWVLNPRAYENTSKPINRSTFHAMMNAAVHNKNVDLAVRVYRDLLQRWRPKLPEDRHETSMQRHQSKINPDLEPTLITYNILLNAYASRKPNPKFSQVYGLYRKMMIRQIEPDQVTYGTLAKAFSKADDQDLVQKLLQDGKIKQTAQK